MKPGTEAACIPAVELSNAERALLLGAKSVMLEALFKAANPAGSDPTRLVRALRLVLLPRTCDKFCAEATDAARTTEVNFFMCILTNLL